MNQIYLSDMKQRRELLACLTKLILDKGRPLTASMEQRIQELPYLDRWRRRRGTGEITATLWFGVPTIPVKKPWRRK